MVLSPYNIPTEDESVAFFFVNAQSENNRRTGTDSSKVFLCMVMNK